MGFGLLLFGGMILGISVELWKQFVSPIIAKWRAKKEWENAQPRSNRK